LQFSLQDASSETFGYILVHCYATHLVSLIKYITQTSLVTVKVLKVRREFLTE